jgi:hypothetical protein
MNEGLRPSLMVCVGSVEEGDRVWSVFLADGDLFTFDEGGRLAPVLVPWEVEFVDAWARGEARRAGLEVPMGSPEMSRECDAGGRSW